MDPDKTQAGRALARARWGPPRRVNIADLEPAEREAILRIIEARRAAKTRANEKAGPVSETSGPAQEADRVADRTPRAA